MVLPVIALASLLLFKNAFARADELHFIILPMSALDPGSMVHCMAPRNNHQDSINPELLVSSSEVDSNH